eukprot:PITA_09047
MKKNIVEYLSQCLECQQIKAEHQHPPGLLQPLPVPEWKWEFISMDFITGLPKTKRNNDSIFVVVDKLSKAAHFIPVQSTYRAAQIAHIFMQNIFRLHGLLKNIISDRDVKFTSAFWKTLFAKLGTQLNFSTAYHPQTDGQMERVNQMVEDMLRAYVMQQPTKWEDYLHLAKRSTLQWSGCAKLAPRYCGPFQILARVGPVAYQLALPSHIRVHNVFHVSVLKKYVYDPRHVIRWQEIQVEPEGEVLVEPLSILDQRKVQLRKRVITQVKVQWRHFGPDEATWEDEELMRKTYPDLFGSDRHRDGVQSQGEEM